MTKHVFNFLDNKIFANRIRCATKNEQQKSFRGMFLQTILSPFSLKSSKTIVTSIGG